MAFTIVEQKPIGTVAIGLNRVQITVSIAVNQSDIQSVPGGERLTRVRKLTCAVIQKYAIRMFHAGAEVSVEITIAVHVSQSHGDRLRIRRENLPRFKLPLAAIDPDFAPAKAGQNNIDVPIPIQVAHRQGAAIRFGSTTQPRPALTKRNVPLVDPNGDPPALDNRSVQVGILIQVDQAGVVTAGPAQPLAAVGKYSLAVIEPHFVRLHDARTGEGIESADHERIQVAVPIEITQGHAPALSLTQRLAGIS
ncbi:MAG: hypothetical protein L0219_21535, partial [Phycisphaerales bacterium]|nr:hypothetical protein [Phycisphaerales bacterium]